MGTTPSSSRPKEETSTNGGFFSNLWLCGGGDAIDENSTERSRRRVASADKETDGRKLRAGADDAKRVTESAELFAQEFKTTMRQRGFAAFKYNRNGRSAPRLFLLDDTETLIQWKTKKTGRGDFDAFSLLDIDGIVRGCETRKVCATNETWRMITIHAPPRRLVMGFETEQRCRMFADGLSLVVAEAQGRAAPQTRRAGASNDSRTDAPKENGVQRLRKTGRERGERGWRF
ncbi:unnamed protein product [Pelagomonas calceolata]|uniref:PH domain-containing protein n=1 Tax=Pelagomonas calceolata TaxID=35677 RepID=A0A8J2SGH3_9STRA|nr:unnamed protein product [Pelagomonas calceolata]